jgi:hypothetical protein
MRGVGGVAGAAAVVDGAVVVVASSASRGELTMEAKEAEFDAGAVWTLVSPARATAPIPITSPVTPATTFLTFIPAPFQRSHYVETIYKTPIFLT